VPVESDPTIAAGSAALQPTDSLAPPGGASPGVLGGRYEILGLLGMGGMGAVYRARDSALSEVVAHKMLRPGFAADNQSIVQFQQEVRLARRVTHKNVARTYDLGEADGYRFLTMELVDGDSLGAVLDQSPALPIARTIDIGLAICDGVAAAHEAGVIHRDLKPDNVVIARDGRVVVMDFGVARAVGESKERGLIVGTPAYMAPEQAQGETDLDARADQYAIGTILFEMLTGQVPFPGTALAPIVRRMIEPPPDPRTLRAEIPEPLAKLVLRCLARAREERFADVAAVGAELRRLRAGANASIPPASTAHRRPARGIPTLAVFPLDMIDLPEWEHLAWGLADGLIDALSAAPGLSVHPRGVTSQMRGAHADARARGRLLGAEVVVHGTVRKSPEGFVAHMRATTVEDGFQIWHRHFRGGPSDIGHFTDEAARAISEAMGLSIPRVEKVLRDPEVLDLYLRGRREYFRFTAASTARAQELLRLASERAPNDPVVLSAYASALGRQIGVDSQRGGSITLARTIAEKAHAAAPDRPEPILALASVALQNGDAAAAAENVARALVLAPDSAESHEPAARLLLEAGALNEGQTHMDIALHLEPRLVGIRYQAARAEALVGNWREAERLLLGPVDVVSPFSYWADRFRLCFWRGDAKWIEGIDVANLPGVTEEERAIGAGAAVVIRERKLSGDVATMFDSLRESAHTTARAKTMFAQLQAEARGYCGRRDLCVQAILAAVDSGLFDSPWLELCPALEGVRTVPEIVAARAVVKERAHAVTSTFARGAAK
jgi:serine/threonine-protein kinase